MGISCASDEAAKKVFKHWPGAYQPWLHPLGYPRIIPFITRKYITMPGAGYVAAGGIACRVVGAYFDPVRYGLIAPNAASDEVAVEHALKNVVEQLTDDAAKYRQSIGVYSCGAYCFESEPNQALPPLVMSLFVYDPLRTS